MKSTGLVFAEKPSIGIEPTNLPDRSRFGNHGTHTDITMVQLPSGLWVRSFNGSSSFILLPDVDVLKLAGNLTILVWVYPNVSQESCLFNNGVGEIVGTLVAQRPSGKFRNIHNSGAEYFLPPEGNLPLNSWHQAGMRFDLATTTLTNINDGVLGASVSEGDASGAGRIQPIIGRMAWGAAAYYSGYLALFKMFNYALSAGQIKKIFEAERAWFGV